MERASNPYKLNHVKHLPFHLHLDPTMNGHGLHLLALSTLSTLAPWYKSDGRSDERKEVVSTLRYHKGDSTFPPYEVGTGALDAVNRED